MEGEQNPTPGFDPAALDRMVAERVGNILQPLFTTAEAVSQFGPEAPQINEFLNANQEVRDRFHRMSQAEPTGAADYVKGLYRQSRAAAGEANAVAENEALNAGNADALADGGVIRGHGDSRKVNTPGEDYENKLQRLAKHAQETGDATEYLRARLFEGPNPIEMWLPGEAPPPGMMKRRYKNLEEIV